MILSQNNILKLNKEDHKTYGNTRGCGQIKMVLRWLKPFLQPIFPFVSEKFHLMRHFLRLVDASLLCKIKPKFEVSTFVLYG